MDTLISSLKNILPIALTVFVFTAKANNSFTGIAITDGMKATVNADILKGLLEISPPAYYLQKNLGFEINILGLSAKFGGKAIPVDTTRYAIVVGEPNDFAIYNYNISCDHGGLHHLNTNIISINVNRVSYVINSIDAHGSVLNGYLLRNELSRISIPMSENSKKQLRNLLDDENKQNAINFANSFCEKDSQQALKNLNLENWTGQIENMTLDMRGEFHIGYKKAKSQKKRSLISVKWNPDHIPGRAIIDETRDFLKEIRDFIDSRPDRVELDARK